MPAADRRARRRRAVAGLALLAAACGLSACESTAEKSARIASAGREAVQASRTLTIRRNPDVRVARAVVVRGVGGAVAAAVEVRNTGVRAQRDVPILIDVRDAHGASLYMNDTVGLQPALQRLSTLRGRRSAWWVNDQVTAASAPRSIRARVGAAPPAAGVQRARGGAATAAAGALRSVRARAGAARAVPRVRLTRVHFEGDSTGRYLTGTVVNPVHRVLRDVSIFAVALKGKRVVAAGRALVPKLPAAGSPKRVVFRLFFVGEPRGARLALTVAPSS